VGETDSVLDVRRRYGVPNAIRLRVDAREAIAWVDGYEVSVREVAAHPDDLRVSTRRGGRAALRRVTRNRSPVPVSRPPPVASPPAQTSRWNRP